MMDYDDVPVAPSIFPGVETQDRLFLHSIQTASEIVPIHTVYKRLRYNNCDIDGLEDYFPKEIAKLIRGYCGNIFLPLLRSLALKKSSTIFYNTITGRNVPEYNGYLFWRLREPRTSPWSRIAQFNLSQLETCSGINFEPTWVEFATGSFLY